MSVAQLFNMPKTQAEWSYWLFSNADEHQQIIDGIKRKFSITLDRYILDPAPQQDTQQFLLWHQIMHYEMDNVLKIGVNDYTSLNFNDPEALEYMWWQHGNEHILARQALGI